MKNAHRLPPETIPVLEQHIGALLRVLSDKLVGVYVHGSAAMGGFNPRTSDLDYLAIVAAPLTPEERIAIARAFTELFGTSGFGKGVEMSIVEARFAGRDFRYPTPFEFHMGGKIEQVERHAKPHEREYVDTDLASHFTVTRERGVCGYGREIDEVFFQIDRAFFLESNAEDIRHARELVVKDPFYVILNLCRALYAQSEGAVLSKLEAAERYLSEARPHRDLVRSALSAYRGGAARPLDRKACLDFVETILRELEPPS